MENDCALINEINGIIKEEMCISDTVKSESYAIITKIKDKISNEKPCDSFNEYGLRHIRCSFTHKFDIGNGNKVDVVTSVVCNQFRNEACYETAINKLNYDAECYSCLRKVCNGYSIIIWINFTSVNTKILSDLNDGVQHEVNHIFQQLNMKGNYPDMMEYGKIKANMNSDNVVARNVANLLYLLNDSEIDSLMNGMHGEVVKDYKKYGTVDGAIYASRTYSKLKEAERYYKYVLDNKQAVKPIIGEYRFCLTEFLRKIEKGFL